MDGNQDIPGSWCDIKAHDARNGTRKVYLALLNNYPSMYDGSCMSKLCLDPALRHVKSQVLVYDDVVPFLDRFAGRDLKSLFSQQAFPVRANLSVTAFLETWSVFQRDICVDYAYVRIPIIIALSAYMVFGFCVFLLLCSGACHGCWRSCCEAEDMPPGKHGCGGNTELLGMWLHQASAADACQAVHRYACIT
jgi:hypothetical protein